MLELKIYMHHKNGPTDFYYQFDCPLCISRRWTGINAGYIKQEAQQHLLVDHRGNLTNVQFVVSEVPMCDEQFIINGSVAKCELEKGYLAHWHEATVDGIQIKWMMPNE